MSEKNENIPQNIILENRRKISVSGVSDVDSFDENQSVIYTCMGLLEIKGADMHMSKLNLDSGEIVLEGKFDSFCYIDSSPESTGIKKPGLFKRLLGSGE